MKKNERYHYTDLAKLIPQFQALPQPCLMNEAETEARWAHLQVAIIWLHEDGAKIDQRLQPWVKESLQHLEINCHKDQPCPWPILILNRSPKQTVSIRLGEGASLHCGLITLNAQPQATPHYLNQHIELAAKAALRLWHASLPVSPILIENTVIVAEKAAQVQVEHLQQSESLHREELDVHLRGDGARLKISGLQSGVGRAHLDYQLRVYHEADATGSEVEFSGIADDHSRVIFDGLIHVPAHIKGVDANEQTRNLLLSNTAEIDAKPELEIYSHEIACRHGASVGNLDENALFYLQSRGFSASEARLLLVQAFKARVFDQGSLVGQLI